VDLETVGALQVALPLLEFVVRRETRENTIPIFLGVCGAQWSFHLPFVSADQVFSNSVNDYRMQAEEAKKVNIQIECVGNSCQRRLFLASTA
jgi:hypothetical protein